MTHPIPPRPPMRKSPAASPGLMLTASVLALSSTLLSASTPPNAAVEMRFSEGVGAGAGVTTANQGLLGGTGTFADLNTASGFPAFSTNVPSGLYVPTANAASVDFGTFAPGLQGRAVDLVTTATPPGNGTAGAYPKLTITAWVNARAFSTRGQFLYALESANGLGFSFGHNALGNFELGINQNVVDGPESIFQLPVDGNVSSNNWVFIAATYDPTLEGNQLKYYYGRPDKLAVLDSSHSYTGAVAAAGSLEFTGNLTLGNLSSVEPTPREVNSNAGNPLFRGLMDEVKVYTNALSLDEIQQAQLNGAVTPVAASILRQPANRITPQGQSAIFNVDATGSGLVTYQWKTNGVNVPGATNAVFTLANVALVENGKLISVGVTNATGGALSGNATLTVVGADPHLIYASFTEGNSRNTNITISSVNQDLQTRNVGTVGGGARITQRNSSSLAAGVFPVFTTNVPVGPFAPDPAYNQFALHMGDVIVADPAIGNQGNRWLDFTNSVGSPANSLGSMNAVTVCGWLNSGNQTFRNVVGNQIAFALNSANQGFVVSHQASGALQLNVNEIPGSSDANESFGFLLADTNHPAANWVFFAVTYDGTQTAQNLNYYFGSPTAEVALDSTSPQDYNKGIITNSGSLTVGNISSEASFSGRLINGTGAGFFRGLIDELHVFNRVLTLEEIKVMQRAPALPAVLKLAKQASNVTLSWEAGAQPLLPAIQLQTRTNFNGDVWRDVTTATNVSGNIRSLTLPSNSEEYFRLRSK